MINVNIINECTTRKLSFPEVIQQLSAIDIESYYMDLIRMQKTYYSRSGESHIEPVLIEDLPTLASNFDEEKIIDAIHASQKGQIDYHAFIKRIIGSGTARYTVYLDGKCVIYTGRKGESHIENFHF